MLSRFGVTAHQGPRLLVQILFALRQADGLRIYELPRPFLYVTGCIFVLYFILDRIRNQQRKFPILMKAEDTFHRFGLLAFYRIQKVRVDMIVAVSGIGDLLAERFAHPVILPGLP